MKDTSIFDDMTLRDVFAVAALASMQLRHFSHYGRDEDREREAGYAAESAFVYADAMLKARDQK
jgi:hypothetical protein